MAKVCPRSGFESILISEKCGVPHFGDSWKSPNSSDSRSPIPTNGTSFLVSDSILARMLGPIASTLLLGLRRPGGAMTKKRTNRIKCIRFSEPLEFGTLHSGAATRFPAGRTPASPRIAMWSNMIWPRHPFMPFRAPPSQWSATIDVLLRETLAAAFIGKLAHVFDRQLQLIDGANWTPRARRLLAIGADAVGRGLPP